MLEAGIEFYTALLGFQTELGAVRKNKKAHTWTYGDLDAIMDHVRELLEKHKLVISPARWTADTGVYLRTKVIHSPTAQGIEDVAPMPAYTADEWDDKEMGKSTTYHRRYALQVLLNLTFENDRSDNDEGSKGKRQQQKSNTSNIIPLDNTITPAQYESLAGLLNSSPSATVLEEKIKNHYKIVSLKFLPHSEYEVVIRRIKKDIDGQ